MSGIKVVRASLAMSLHPRLPRRSWPVWPAVERVRHKLVIKVGQGAEEQKAHQGVPGNARAVCVAPRTGLPLEFERLRKPVTDEVGGTRKGGLDRDRIRRDGRLVRSPVVYWNAQQDLARVPAPP
eukprot:scaffold4525_cov125-Isochrysis_galbana.AAC.10